MFEGFKCYVNSQDNILREGDEGEMWGRGVDSLHVKDIFSISATTDTLLPLCVLLINAQ